MEDNKSWKAHKSCESEIDNSTVFGLPITTNGYGNHLCRINIPKVNQYDSCNWTSELQQCTTGHANDYCKYNTGNTDEAKINVRVIT